jgi:hypothetical protein
MRLGVTLWLTDNERLAATVPSVVVDEVFGVQLQTQAASTGYGWQLQAASVDSGVEVVACWALEKQRLRSRPPLIGAPVTEIWLLRAREPDSALSVAFDKVRPWESATEVAPIDTRAWILQVLPDPASTTTTTITVADSTSTGQPAP